MNERQRKVYLSWFEVVRDLRAIEPKLITINSKESWAVREQVSSLMRECDEIGARLARRGDGGGFVDRLVSGSKDVVDSFRGGGGGY